MKQSTLGDHEDSGCIDHTDEDTLRSLYWESEHSISEIADLAGVSYGTVHYWMEKHDIERLSDVDGSFRTQSKRYVQARMNTNGHIVWRDQSTDGGGTMPVHRLLAISEYGVDAVKGNDVHHKNGVPWDNRPENIDILSRSEHMSHHNIGQNNPDSKLCPCDVEEIRDRLDRGETPYSISDDYAVSSTAIRKIREGELWRHHFDN